MKNILMTIEYDGTNYCGWQIQKNGPSIQGVLTETISSLLGENIIIHGSGRTDSGVHALGQKANFIYSGKFPQTKLLNAINTYLPDDIKIVDLEETNEDFHAQYSAKEKTYYYHFYVSRIKHPLIDRYSVNVPYSIGDFDYDLAKQSLNCLLGTIDLKPFSSTGSNIKNTIRTIFDIDLEKNNENFTLKITANGFLYNTVRIIVGTLVKIGLHQLPPDTFNMMLQTKRRNLGGVTYPPRGLFLVDVKY